MKNDNPLSVLIVMILFFVIIATAFLFQSYEQKAECIHQFGESFSVYQNGEGLQFRYYQGIICEEKGECRGVIYKLDGD